MSEHSAESMIGADRAAAMLGIELLGAGDGTARTIMTVRPDMVNGLDLCHGGLVATLADTAFAAACNSRSRVTVAAGFDVTFLRPGKVGDRLLAEAREVVLQGRSGVYDVVVTREKDGSMVAVFRGRSRATGA
ncbi:MAG: hydroxyphenylacetyl-CoA thioesterase PaaI [Nocardioides sp.]|nr:hydroxyphenylacetyl-CoA thioesterase PaaI [Nocardioides sp.]